MKKTILILAGVLSFSVSNAQKIDFGVKGGLNLSSTNPGSGMQLGIHLGGFAEYKFNDKFAIQPELLYSKEGGKNEYSDVFFLTTDVYNYSQKISLSNITLPIIFKYYVSDKFSIEAGPQINFLIGSNVEFNLVDVGSGDVYTSETTLKDTKTLITYRDNSGNIDLFLVNHDFKQSQINASFNIGGSYNLSDKMFIQARYNLGLTNFSKNSNLLAGTEISSTSPLDISRFGETQKASNIQVSFGYKF